ncbi:hypothetical protein Avbf_11207 [Armadillidium vulgare]|nr:hypothetical protein Avbf_11207 [Armadillidium vulgare]
MTGFLLIDTKLICIKFLLYCHDYESDCFHTYGKYLSALAVVSNLCIDKFHFLFILGRTTLILPLSL